MNMLEATPRAGWSRAFASPTLLQHGDTDMRSPRTLACLTSAALALVTLPAGAQLASSAAGTSAITSTSLDVTPYAGYMMFGHFIDGPLGTSLSSSAAPVYGAQLAFALMPGVKLTGNIAHAAGDLKVGIPLLGGINAGTTSALMMDGGVQLSLPMPQSRLAYVPFVEAGVGATRWNVNLGSSSLQARSTNLTGNLGAGLDLNFGPSIALRLMAKDYIGKFDFKQATALDVSGKTMNNVAVTAGIRIGF
jgi:hypothetical protein